MNDQKGDTFDIGSCLDLDFLEETSESRIEKSRDRARLVLSNLDKHPNVKSKLQEYTETKDEPNWGGKVRRGVECLVCHFPYSVTGRNYEICPTCLDVYESEPLFLEKR